MSPIVTVVVPVYNGERYLAEALESVLAQPGPFELDVVVVDDGSTDGSAAQVSRFLGESPVRWLAQAHQGLSAALNHGVAAARGDFLAFLDADDLWTPGKLALQLAALQEEPTLDMVFASLEQFHSPELTEEERARSHFPPGAQPARVAGSMLIHTPAFHRVGPLELELQVGQFVSWISRAQDLGLRYRILPEVGLRRRLHGSNMGLEQRDRSDYLKLLRASLQRRRAQSS